MAVIMALAILIGELMENDWYAIFILLLLAIPWAALKMRAMYKTITTIEKQLNEEYKEIIERKEEP